MDKEAADFWIRGDVLDKGAVAWNPLKGEEYLSIRMISGALLASDWDSCNSVATCIRLRHFKTLIQFNISVIILRIDLWSSTIEIYPNLLHLRWIKLRLWLIDDQRQIGIPQFFNGLRSNAYFVGKQCNRDKPLLQTNLHQMINCRGSNHKSCIL